MSIQPTAVKNVTPYIQAAPVSIDRIVKALQVQFTNDLTWLTNSFNRAVYTSNFVDDAQVVSAKVWVDNGQDELDIIARDDWQAYSFFFAEDEEIPIEYNENESSLYERELSVYFWFNLCEIDDTKTGNELLADLKLEILQAIRTVTLSGDDEVSVNSVVFNPLEIYSDFTIDPTQTQLLYYPYGGLRIDLNASYRDVNTCDIQLAAPSAFVFSNPTGTTLDANITSNSGGEETGFAWYISINNISFSLAGTTGSGITTFQYDSLVEDTLYYGKAKALGVIDSDFSNTDSESTEASAFDPWAQNWFDRADLFGDGFTDDEKIYINTFALAERNDGNLTSYDEFFLLVTGAANSLVGAVSKTGVANGGISFDINGVDFNGVNGYIDTDFTPSIDGTNYTLDNCALGGFVTSEFTTNAIFGNRTVSGQQSEYFVIGANKFAPINGGLQFLNTTWADDQLLIIQRNASNSSELFADGVSVATNTVASTSLSSGSIYLGATNPASLYGNGSLATFYIGGGLADHAAHNTNVRNLLTSLGTLP